MADLYLVRHAQASFGQDNYDQLSELGYQQGVWLGEYFAEREIAFDRLITGSLQRHKQTMEGIAKSQSNNLTVESHLGFNEFDFKSLLEAYAVNHDLSQLDPANSREIYHYLKLSMMAWANGELDQSLLPESWDEFNHRVSEALDYACSNDGEKVLVVSSGGAISMALSHIMNFGAETLINLNLQSRNTGVTQCYYNKDVRRVSSFNNVPHLDVSDRLHAITYV